MSAKLAAPLVLLFAGLALGWVLFHGDPDLERTLDAQRDSTALYRQNFEAAEARADSLASATVAKVDTFVRWRTRWDTTVVHSTDTLTVTEVIAIADSTIGACEDALGSCMETVAAKDSALAAATERAEALERYRDELADRLRREKRWSWFGTTRDALIGGVVGYVIGRAQ